MMQEEYRLIAVDMIDVAEDRLRAVRAERIEVLSKDIAANGLLQPVGVVEETGGRFTLIFGLHRLRSVQALGRTEIAARVMGAAWVKPQERRVLEIMENLNREDLSKLQRAENLAELKRVHEQLYPDTRKGVAGGKARQKTASEIFSFAVEAAEKTGLSRRAIEIAVAIVGGLTDDSKTRVRGTWLEDHQAGLKALSEQPASMQAKICDLLFSTPPQAASVADAVILAEGGRLKSGPEKLLNSVISNFVRLSDRDRRALFDAHEDAVRAYAREKGWL